MSILDIAAIPLAGGQENLRLNVVPDQCPLCHKNVHPKFVIATVYENVAQAVYQCTSLQCERLFIGTYFDSQERFPGRRGFALRNVAPVSPEKASFPKIIADASPSFVEIYDQVIAAESMGLDQMVGIGLRKALEFLVKDYAVTEYPDKAGEIMKATLAQCINNYVSEARIKECAKRAVWLGNDETHYIKKWEDKDLNDLKTLVRLTVIWIESSLLTKQYMDDMADGK